ncbi:MAG: hypothetical protein Q7T18_04055, partial [Sedimentisphaerales bacterium]|nr:hypothetical protein [Sedimentisphaerales bacterium]
ISTTRPSEPNAYLYVICPILNIGILHCLLHAMTKVNQFGQRFFKNLSKTIEAKNSPLFFAPKADMSINLWRNSNGRIQNLEF